MKYISALYSFFIIALCFMVASGSAAAQYMADYPSTYIDSWAGTDGVHAWGEVDGTLYPTHTYKADITITSPGRTVSREGTFSSGPSGSNELVVPWDINDTGDYLIEVNYRGWCNAVLLSFQIYNAFMQGTVGHRITYFTNPLRDGLYDCVYQSQACTSGSPTCSGGYYLGPWVYCPNYLKVDFLTWTQFFVTSCFPVGKGSEATGGGPCN